MSEDNIVFIHLSDIHFKYSKDGGIYDLDEDLRNELELDAIKIQKEFGILHGILVTGDIVYSGKPEEYENVLNWLKELCEKLNCQTENVWTVPGNHDVNWSSISGSTIIQDIHRNLRSIFPELIDHRFSQHYNRHINIRFGSLSLYSFKAESKFSIIEP